MDEVAGTLLRRKLRSWFEEWNQRFDNAMSGYCGSISAATGKGE